MNVIPGQVPDVADVHVQFDVMEVHHFVGRSIVESPMSTDELKDAAAILAANLELVAPPYDGQHIEIEAHNFNDSFEDMREAMQSEFDPNNADD